MKTNKVCYRNKYFLALLSFWKAPYIFTIESFFKIVLKMSDTNAL